MEALASCNLNGICAFSHFLLSDRLSVVDLPCILKDSKRYVRMDALLLAPKHHGRLQPVFGCRRPSQQSYVPFKPAFLWASLSESNPNAERSQYQTTCRWSRSPAAKQSRLAEDMVCFTVQWICLVLHDLASRVYQPNSCMF